MPRGIKTTIIGLIGATLISSSALAGGFSRGTANLDGLYADGFELYSGLIFVSPGRSYENIVGTLGASADQTFAEDYYVPYVSFGGKLVGDLSCVGSYTQPYGAKSTYEGLLRFDTAARDFVVDEYGLTCAYGADLGRGTAYLIGGAFYEALDYFEAQDFSVGPLSGGGQAPGESTLNMTSEAWGFRIGAAYEIPEIALRASVIYRSQTVHDASGMYNNVPFAAIAAGRLWDPTPYVGMFSAGASAQATLPQSLEINLRSGIAPGWLAFGSIKWTDWSVLQSLVVVEEIDGAEWSDSDFFFKDGWTVSGGIAHQFNNEFGGSVSVTWDKGVTSGYDTLSDTWTVATGVRYAKDNIAISAGGAAIYFTEAAKTLGDDYTATSPGEWGYALSLSGSVKF
ncbi:MAG: outer membrane protein transport protein [Oricola sp.]|nr:outer membrane protein transport protein [Oricola sp.]